MKGYDSTCKWTEVIYELKDKPPITGWVSSDYLTKKHSALKINSSINEHHKLGDNNRK